MKYDAYKKQLARTPPEELMREVLNDRYNDFCSRYADDDLREYTHDHRDKTIPYMGWYWRSVDFFNLDIPIGRSGTFVGFMENNKWDHPERRLTEEEARIVIATIDKAIAAEGKGGQLSQTRRNIAKHLDELCRYLQGLNVPYVED